MTLLLFSFRHTSLLTVHTDLHSHTASGCLCRCRPLQWCLMYLSWLSGCPKSSQRDAPSSGISLKKNSGCQIWRMWRVVEHSHFSLGQKLLDDCRVVEQSVVDMSPRRHASPHKTTCKTNDRMLPHNHTRRLTFQPMILTRIKKLPDDDHLMIETCWSDFKCFSV
jgi:hypothetical protein